MSRPIHHYSRVHYRIAVHYPAVMVHEARSTVVLVTNLSVQGCAIEDEQCVPLGSDVELRIQCPTTSTIIITAKVRWQHENRYGLEFAAIPNHIYAQLRAVVINQLTGMLHSAEGTV